MPVQIVPKLRSSVRTNYTRVGCETRELIFHPNGSLKGAGTRETHWRIEPQTGELLILGQDHRLTASLREIRPGHWTGKWQDSGCIPIEVQVRSNQTETATRDFSQRGEQLFLEEYFSGQMRGYCVDIGAADGIRDSNTRALILSGWYGVLVEPIREYFERLEDLYADQREIHVINAAISDYDGVGDIWLARDRQGRVQADNRHTLIPSYAAEVAKGSAREECESRLVPVISVRTLFTVACRKKIDLVSIDAEGMDCFIVASMLRQGVRPRVVMFEVDKNTVATELLHRSCQESGYRLIYRNGVNEAWTLDAPDSQPGVTEK